AITVAQHRAVTDANPIDVNTVAAVQVFDHHLSVLHADARVHPTHQIVLQVHVAFGQSSDQDGAVHDLDVALRCDHRHGRDQLGAHARLTHAVVDLALWGGNYRSGDRGIGRHHHIL